MQRSRRWCCLTLVALCVILPPTWGQDPAPGNAAWQEDRELTVSPTPAPVPALRYRLFPLAADRRPGDAAPIYLRLAHERSDQTKRDLIEKPADWLKLPLDQLPVADARKFLDGHRYNLKQIELGARRKQCDWQYTLDTNDLVHIRLGDAQEMRMHLNVLALAARVDVAAGDFPAALHSLETGMAFSQHVAEGPFLINGLIGLAGVNIMTERLAELIGRPGAPNLYWALTALPRPLIDLRRPLEMEQRWVEMEVPELATLDAPRSAAEWDQLWGRVWSRLAAFEKALHEPDGKPAKDTKAAAPKPSSAEELQEGRKYLTERIGLDAAQVAKMPAAQVRLLRLVWQLRELRDDFFKATYLPYPAVGPVVAAAEKRLNETPETDAVRMARLMLPAIAKVGFAQARTERRLAALRVVEALRMHAAAHGGALPDKLSDVTAVPVPDDPVMGKPFAYRRDGATATLSSRASGEPSPGGLRYRLTVR